MSQPRKRSPLLTIFLTVFIDMLGIGIIIPVIPALFFEPGTSIFAPSVSETTRSVLYGLLIASFPFMQFFGAPILGALSDRYGRRPVLTASLVGTLIGYLLFAYAILIQNLPLLFISRMLPGFMGGNISVIMSAISDISDAQSKVKNFGLVGAAFGIGFILGPTIGGILADETVVPWFNHATPFWFTAILTGVNILFVQVAFPETLPPNIERGRRISPWTGFRNIGASFQLAHLRTIFTVVLLLSLGFSFFTQFFSVYLIQKFHYSEKNIGLLYGWIGIWLAFTQGFLIRRVTGRFEPVQVLTISILTLSLAMGAILLPREPWLFFILNPLIAISQGLTMPNITATISAQASQAEQGQILGINQSMQSLGQIIPPLIAGYVNALNQNLPLLMGSLLVFAGWVVFAFVFRGREVATV